MSHRRRYRDSRRSALQSFFAARNSGYRTHALPCKRGQGAYLELRELLQRLETDFATYWKGLDPAEQEALGDLRHPCWVPDKDRDATYMLLRQAALRPEKRSSYEELHERYREAILEHLEKRVHQKIHSALAKALLKRFGQVDLVECAFFVDFMLDGQLQQNLCQPPVALCDLESGSLPAAPDSGQPS